MATLRAVPPPLEAPRGVPARANWPPGSHPGCFLFPRSASNASVGTRGSDARPNYSPTRGGSSPTADISHACYACCFEGLLATYCGITSLAPRVATAGPPPPWALAPSDNPIACAANKFACYDGVGISPGAGYLRGLPRLRLAGKPPSPPANPASGGGPCPVTKDSCVGGGGPAGGVCAELASSGAWDRAGAGAGSGAGAGTGAGEGERERERYMAKILLTCC